MKFTVDTVYHFLYKHKIDNFFSPFCSGAKFFGFFLIVSSDSNRDCRYGAKPFLILTHRLWTNYFPRARPKSRSVPGKRFISTNFTDLSIDVLMDHYRLYIIIVIVA